MLVNKGLISPYHLSFSVSPSPSPPSFSMLYYSNLNHLVSALNPGPSHYADPCVAASTTEAPANQLASEWMTLRYMKHMAFQSLKL